MKGFSLFLTAAALTVAVASPVAALQRNQGESQA